MTRESEVYIWVSDQRDYPISKYYFSPSKKYPEYPYSQLSEIDNTIYDIIREGFHKLKLDDDNYGSKYWNPLSTYIKLGDTVLVKPNMVLHENGIKNNGIGCLITNPSLVRVILDYIILALKGTGRIIVADAPLQECNYSEMLKNIGYTELIDFYKINNINIEFIDLRNYKSIVKNGVYIQQSIEKLNNNIAVNLGEYSEFSNLPAEMYEKLRVTNYDPDIMKQHHSKNKNEYSIAAEILNADVIINMPKPKTHRKAGLTISLKNMIGINTNKEWLPHHMIGSSKKSGDEYKYNSVIKNIHGKLLDKKNRCIGLKKYTLSKMYNYPQSLALFLSKISSKDNYLEGSWYGNDTIWRTILDLNRIVRYANKDGIICSTQQRKIFNVADMIISGEGEGPLAPSPKSVGIIAMSEDAVCMDEVLATIMGVDYHHLPSINNARTPHILSIGCPDPAHIISNNPNWNNKRCDELNVDDCLSFVLTSGWDSAPSIKRK